MDDDFYDFIIAILAIVGVGGVYTFWPGADIWDSPLAGPTPKNMVMGALLVIAMLAVTFKDRLLERAKVTL